MAMRELTKKASTHQLPMAAHRPNRDLNRAARLLAITAKVLVLLAGVD